MRRYHLFFLCNLAAALELATQTAVDVPRAEEKQKQQNAVAKEQEKHAQSTTTVEFGGEQASWKRSMVQSRMETIISTSISLRNSPRSMPKRTKATVP